MKKTTLFMIACLGSLAFASPVVAAPAAPMSMTSKQAPLEAGKFCCKSSTKTGGKGCYEQNDTSKSCPIDRYTISCTGNTTLSPEGPNGTGTLTCGVPSTVAPTKQLAKPRTMKLGRRN